MNYLAKCLCIFSVLVFGEIYGCTGIVQKAQDGSTVYARTMEFGAELLSFDLLFAPRGIAFEGQSNPGLPKATWTNKYAFVGFNPFGLSLVADGLNEKGLACGGFYFPGWAEYQQATNDELKTAISNLDLITWILGNFETVPQVLEALKHTKVIGVTFGPWKMIPPLHYVVVDASGDKAVIEYVDGKLYTYKMPTETITNSPPFNWHLLNARNYIGLNALNKPAVKINGSELAQFGQGSGALGLPGDFTPPSRFIRASFFNQVVLRANDPKSNVQRAFKILNQFDIPKGSVRDKESDGKEVYEDTQWTSAADLTGQKYYFHTYANRDIRFVDLKKMDLDQKEIKSIKLDQPNEFKDLSMDLK